MKSLFISISIILSINLCLTQESDTIQKTMLISTNLTKEELYQILSSAEKGTNNTSVDEVETQAISDTETLIKNGKVKIKIKLEFDLNNDQNIRKAFIQTITPIKTDNEKISFINCFLALAVCIALILCFSLSLKIKKNGKLFLNKYNFRKEYLLKDD